MDQHEKARSFVLKPFLVDILYWFGYVNVDASECAFVLLGALNSKKDFFRAFILGTHMRTKQKAKYICLPIHMWTYNMTTRYEHTLTLKCVYPFANKSCVGQKYFSKEKEEWF